MNVWLLQSGEAVLLPPEFDLVRSTDDGGDAAGVHLQQGHLSRGVRGEEGRASSLSPAHVPAGQAQLHTLRVLWEQALAKCQADATAEKHTGTKVTHYFSM